MKTVWINFSVACLLLLGINISTAQEVRPHKVSLHAGAGFVAPNFRFTPKPEGIAYNFRAEVRLNERFGLSLFTSKAKFSTKYHQGFDDVVSAPDVQHTYQAFGVRAEGNIVTGRHVDVYGGVSIYHISHEKRIFSEQKLGRGDSDRSHVLFGGTIGARYYVMPDISVYAELASSATAFNVGVGYHL